MFWKTVHVANVIFGLVDHEKVVVGGNLKFRMCVHNIVATSDTHGCLS